jgi:hypothetical protein
MMQKKQASSKEKQDTSTVVKKKKKGCGCGKKEENNRNETGLYLCLFHFFFTREKGCPFSFNQSICFFDLIIQLLFRIKLRFLNKNSYFSIRRTDSLAPALSPIKVKCYRG